MYRMALVASAVVLLHAGHAYGQQELIDEGRRLFFEETFNGNGRTCGTCHAAENNFTIDPAFIATLPDDDPLFVAEFNPDLAELENPELMREFGLILENLDGFDAPPVFRGVPHTLGLRASIEPDPVSGRVHALGWSGDGSPNDGSLRSFAVGAVIQHFPRTLARVEGQDFRLPTDAELDALEAFQLSTGRRTEIIDLATAEFLDPEAERGADLFDGVDINRACSGCHANGGAMTSDGINANFDTGTAALSVAGSDNGFGDGSFNTASVVEAADSPPFFHNNSAETIEDAVRFYTSPVFAASPAGEFGGAFDLTDNQIIQVAAFLRAINAVDNADNSAGLLRVTRRPEQRGQRLAQVISDIEDGIEVLTGGPIQLAPDAVAEFERARARLEGDPSGADVLRASRILAGIRELIMLDGAQVAEAQ